jgi:hypothetical protein
MYLRLSLLTALAIVLCIPAMRAIYSKAKTWLT